MSSVLGIQLINIIYLTGSGRAGLVLPIFLMIVVSLKRLSYTKLVPIIVFTPLLLWLLVYSYKLYAGTGVVLLTINELMSNRLAIYLDSITVLISNSQSVIGWGVSPWGDYTLADVSVTNSIGTYGENLIRSHNFFFEFAIQYGIIAGVALLTSVFITVKKLSHSLRRENDPTKLATTVVVLGVIFTGLLVGGKMGPFSIEGRANIFWWIALAYLIGSSSKQ
jgi:hypothetical protein